MLPNLFDQLARLPAQRTSETTPERFPRFQPDSGSATTLRYLAKHPDLSPPELARATSLRYETVQAALRRAVENSWASQRYTSTIRGQRRYTYTLTPAGLAVLRHNFPEDFSDAEA